MLTLDQVKEIAEVKELTTLEDVDFQYAIRLSKDLGYIAIENIMLKWHIDMCYEQGCDCRQAANNEECYR